MIAPFQRVTTTFSFAWRAVHCHGCIRIVRLAALNVAAGTTLRLHCTGKCHVTRRVRQTSKDVARVDLRKALRLHRLRPGAVLELRASIPGQIASVKRLRVVKKRGGGLDVKDQTLCVSPTAPKKLRTHCQTIG